MESSYGIGISNRFELYCDDDVEDPFEILKRQEAELEKLKSQKSHKTKPSKVVGPKGTPTVKADVKVPIKDRKLSNNASKFKTPDDKNITNVENSASEGWLKEEPRKSRSSAGGRGISRGRGTSSVFDQRGKREFDRQSGSNKSGVKPVEKRDGSGAHNWGSTKNMLVEELHYHVVEPETAVNRQRNTSGDLPAVEKAKPEEESVMTLEEWKQKEQVKRSVPTFNLRKPGEGDGKKWGNVYMLKKKDDEGDDDDDELYEDDVTKRGRQKQHLDIEIRFHDVTARGRGRGRGGRSKNIAESEQLSMPAPIIATSVPKVDDLNDFPSLSIT